MLIGTGAALLGGSLWGVSGTSVQFLTTQAGAPPSLITFMRVLIGGLLFFAFLMAKDRRNIAGMFTSKRTVAWLFLFAFGLYSNQLCYAQTVQITNAGTATVLQMLGSVFVMLYVCIDSRKLPKPKELCGLLLAVGASMLIATQGDVRTLNMPPDGLMWGIATGLTTAVYIVVPKKSGLFERFGSIPTVGMGMLLSSVFAIPVYALQGIGAAETTSILGAFGPFEWYVFIFGLIVVGTMCGYGFYLYGVSIVGSVRGSLIGAIEPVSATVIAALWLGTAFTGWDIAGLVAMCVMLLLIS